MAVSDLLSQDEIDALLHGVDDVEDHQPRHYDLDQDHPEIQHDNA